MSTGRTQFTLNGQRYELNRAVVEGRLSGVTPEAVQKHSVQVGGTWFPVVQAFEVAVGVSRADFTSKAARRHLLALGFEMADESEAGPTAGRPRVLRVVSADDSSAVATTAPADEVEWHTEANVQASLVTALAADGWRILSVANTATKEHGIDVIASLGGRTVGVEVKGFPSRNYADPSRAGEMKRTSPSTQAGHWYSQAVLAAMRLRGKEPGWSSVIALPDFPRYRDLFSETAGSLGAAQIEVWWVKEDGSVDRSSQ